MTGGWIKLHRALTAHWLWAEKPFDKKSAWIDLLLLANHRPGKVLFGSELLELDCGDVVTSEVKLAERWGWSRQKVRGFLKKLEGDGMLRVEKDTHKTKLQICRFAQYQSVAEQKTDSQQTAHRQPMNSQSTANGQPMDTYKKEKKENQIKRKERKEEVFIPPTLEAVQEYCREQGYSLDGEKFIDYYSSKGWKIGSTQMQDWQAALRNWAKREKEWRSGNDGEPTDSHRGNAAGENAYGIPKL